MNHVHKANLKNPETGALVAHFQEESKGTGTVEVRVSLSEPIKLSNGANLAIFAAGTATPVVATKLTGTEHKTVDSFHGVSTIGSLPAGTEISIVRQPGGRLDTLLVVLGQGLIE